MRRREASCEFCRTSRSRWRAARRSPSWVRLAAARARCCTSLVRSTLRRRAPSRSRDRTRMRPRRAEQAAFRNNRIGFVFQDHSLLPQCSVLERARADPRSPDPTNGLRSTIERGRRSLLAQVGLSDRLEHRPALKLSGGEKQRAALARAPIRDPLLLLCDEPPVIRSRLGRKRCDAAAGASCAAEHDPRRRHAQRRARGSVSREIRDGVRQLAAAT